MLAAEAAEEKLKREEELIKEEEMAKEANQEEGKRKKRGIVIAPWIEYFGLIDYFWFKHIQIYLFIFTIYDKCIFFVVKKYLQQ